MLPPYPFVAGVECQQSTLRCNVHRVVDDDEPPVTERRVEVVFPVDAGFGSRWRRAGVVPAFRGPVIAFGPRSCLGTPVGIDAALRRTAADVTDAFPSGGTSGEADDRGGCAHQHLPPTHGTHA